MPTQTKTLQKNADRAHLRHIRGTWQSDLRPAETCQGRHLGGSLQPIISSSGKSEKCGKRVIWLHGAHVWDSMHCTENTSVPIQTPSFASRCSMDHASFRSSLASHSQVADMGDRCSERCVFVKHCAVARKTCSSWIEYPHLLTQTSLLGGRFCRSLRCVVCTSKTAYFCASMLPPFCLCVSTLVPNQVFALCFYAFSTLSRFSVIYWL